MSTKLIRRGDNAIVVVGVPFLKEDIEQKATMDFLKSRFGGMKGHYYSQVYPAMSKVFQVINGGVGTKDDKRVCVLLDCRYKEQKYLKALPPQYRINIESDISEKVGQFFNELEPTDENLLTRRS